MALSSAPESTGARDLRALALRVDDFVQLTKPGILSLLLVTMLCGMMVAVEGAPPLGLTIFALIGGTLAAGGANAINCFIDRDIDALMPRTQRRGTASGAVSPREALVFGVTISAAAVLLLGLTTTWLAAGLALAGNLYYVFVYTLWLKRRTPQNIVIGGAAGAFPPLVGWAAATGSLSVLAVLMFAIIYYWTPPHFWALALLKQGEYGRVGVPMLPVVVGEAETRRQILLYSILLAAISLIPVAFGLGEIYLAGAVLLNAAFLLGAVRLYLTPTKARARGLFFASLWYLALIFAVMVVDRAVLA